MQEQGHLFHFCELDLRVKGRIHSKTELTNKRSQCEL